MYSRERQGRGSEVKLAEIEEEKLANKRDREEGPRRVRE